MTFPQSFDFILCGLWGFARFLGLDRILGRAARKPLTQRARRIRKGHEASETIDDSGNTVAHVHDVKVEQITELETAEPQIAQKLGAMHG